MQDILGKEKLFNTSSHLYGVLIGCGAPEASQNYKDVFWGCDGPSLLIATVSANMKLRDFPGGTVVKNPPANVGDTGSIPGPGRSHMPWSN